MPIPNIRASKNLIAENIAKNLVSKIRSVEIKEFIKEQSLKRFDGDDNFLIGTSLNYEIPYSNSRTGSIKFIDIISGISSSSARTVSSLVDSLTEFYPLLQVSVIVPEEDSLENWNTEATPLVAYVPLTDSIEFIPAYDSQGNYLELSPEIQPNEVVIAISENERLIGLTASEIDLIECANFQDLTPHFSTS